MLHEKVWSIFLLYYHTREIPNSKIATYISTLILLRGVFGLDKLYFAQESFRESLKQDY